LAPLTSADHSHSTMDAATVQNTTNGTPPIQAARIATGASTADEMTRRTRLLGPEADSGTPGCGSVTNSGSGLDGEPAEPALAAAIFLDRGFERGAVEVGPIDRREHKLRISRLPQQEVRQPLLARGADDEVGIA